MIKTSSTAHRQNKKHKKLISMQRHWFNGLVTNHPKFWTRLGNFESKVLEFDLEPLKINSPIYVSGLARSGSTILLEFLADHKDFVSHKYSDFPFIYTPYLWRVMQKLLFMKAGQFQSRSCWSPRLALRALYLRQTSLVSLMTSSSRSAS